MQNTLLCISPCLSTNRKQQPSTSSSGSRGHMNSFIHPHAHTLSHTCIQARVCAVGRRNKWRETNNILALQKQMLINNKIVGAIPSKTRARTRDLKWCVWACVDRRIKIGARLRELAASMRRTTLELPYCSDCMCGCAKCDIYNSWNINQMMIEWVVYGYYVFIYTYIHERTYVYMKNAFSDAFWHRPQDCCARGGVEASTPPYFACQAQIYRYKLKVFVVVVEVCCLLRLKVCFAKMDIMI